MWRLTLIVWSTTAFAAWVPLEGVSQASRDEPLFERIDRYVEHERDASRMPGIAIAIVRHGDIVHTRGFGDDGRAHAITPQTPFPIGSLTKSFTALAIRQLEEAGRIRLDDPVQRYLPWFAVADADASARITVRHLLNQTSGLSRAAGIAPVAAGSQASLPEIVRSIQHLPLNRPVGQSYEYSNLNYAILGLLVETMANEPWTTYVERRVFAPLGLTHSHTTFSAARDARMTQVHQYWFGVPRRSELAYLPGLAPTGYLAASADDMGQYLAMYLGGGTTSHARVLSREGAESMLTPATNETAIRLLSTPFTVRYAEGWFVGTFGAAADARWHLGQLPSFTAWMILLPQSDEGVVVLINIGSQIDLFGGNAALSRIPIGIVNLLRNEPPPTGISVSRFYVWFDLIVAATLGLLMWTVARVARIPARRPTQGSARAWTVAAVVCGLGLAAALVAGVPVITRASWLTMWRFTPDLTLVLLTVATLSVSISVLCARRLGQSLAGRRFRS